MRRNWLLTVGLAIGLLAGLGGCKDETGSTGATDKDQTAEADEKTPPDARGVDYETETIHIGALNDESGRAAAIGQPFAVGKRILVERVNRPETDLLPGDWTLKLHEEDHGYNTSKAIQAYKKLGNDVLFFATSFGTPTTLRLRKLLKKDNLIAFPASLSTEMAEHEYTPPLGTSYKLEAMRAMDFAVREAGSAAEVKAGIVYHKDDYGNDGLSGWKQAAEAHGVEIVAEQTVSAGRKHVTPVIESLRDAGANYVLLTVLPSSTAPILQTAEQHDYTPTWIGNTPAWIDGFFAENGPLSADALANFYWATGFPYWGEDVPGMDQFIEAYEQYGNDQHPRNFYILSSYLQGLVQLEILRRTIESGTITRENFRKQMHQITEFDAGGMMPPLTLAKTPYVTGTEARVLKPVPADKTWKVAGDDKTPKAFESRDAARKAIENQRSPP